MINLQKDEKMTTEIKEPINLAQVIADSQSRISVLATVGYEMI